MGKNLQFSVYLDYYGVMLTGKQRDLAEMYYNEDLSLGEIAEITGITRQGVHDSLKRTEQILLEFEQNIQLVEKTAAMMKTMEAVRLKSRMISELCKESNCPNKIIEQLDELENTASIYLKKFD